VKHVCTPDCSPHFFRGLFLNAAILFLGLLWMGAFSCDARADTGAFTVTDLPNACREYEICRDHAAVSSCTNGADEAVVAIQGPASLRLGVLGTTGTFTANVRTSMLGHDLGGVGTEVFTDVTTADGTGQVANTVFGYVWGEVDVCTGCSVDMRLIVCPR